jgi:hypothetical protein
MKNIANKFLGLLPVSTLLFAPSVRADAPPEQTKFNGATPLEWSVRMANSETARRGDKLAYKPGGGGGKWDYSVGLFTL